MTHKDWNKFILSAALVLLGRGWAGEGALARFEFSRPQMGTLCRIVLYAKDGDAARAASNAAFDRVSQLNQILSDYLPTSEIMQLCDKSGGAPVKVSPELYKVLSYSLKIAEQSDGAFDVTIGPLVGLWRKSRKSLQLPSAEEVADAKSRSGYRFMKLDEAAQTVQLTQKGMRLDVGGIAKGYSCDEVILTLQKHGIDSALAALGGDIVVGKAPPGTEGWTVGIAPLEDANNMPSRCLVLRDAAVSTSGDAEQFVVINGVRYSHILDPKTGLGMTNHSSVTVVAPHGIISDGLDTTVSVLGHEKGMALIESWPDTAAIMLLSAPGGEQVFESKRWDALPKGKAKSTDK